MSASVLFLVIAVVLFALGGFTSWWPSGAPYHPRFVAAGLFFWSLSVLWPQIHV